MYWPLVFVISNIRYSLLLPVNLLPIFIEILNIVQVVYVIVLGVIYQTNMFNVIILQINSYN